MTQSGEWRVEELTEEDKKKLEDMPSCCQDEVPEGETGFGDDDELEL